MTTSRIGTESPASSVFRTSRAGFTFLELLVVALTLGLLVGLAAPRLRQSWVSFQTERTAFNIAQSLRAARTLAVTESQPVDWLWDQASRQFCLGSPEIADCAHPNRSDRFGHSHRLEPFLQLTITREDAGEHEPISRISFWPNGTSQATTILVSHEARARYQLTVESATGQVAVRKTGLSTEAG